MGFMIIGPPSVAFHRSAPSTSIQSHEVTLAASGKQDVRSCGQNACRPGGGLPTFKGMKAVAGIQLEFPFLFSRLRVERADGGELLIIGAYDGNGPGERTMSSAIVAISFLILLITLDEQGGIVFPGVYIEEAGLGAKGRIEPVGAALIVREDQGSFRAALRIGRHDGPAVLIKSGVPVLLDEGLA